MTIKPRCARYATVMSRMVLILPLFACTTSDRIAETVSDKTTPGLILISRGPIAYPPELERQLIQGRVVMDCAIDANGAQHDCRLVQTTNHGFDQATRLFFESQRYQAKKPGLLPLPHHLQTLNYSLNLTPS